MIDRTRYPFGSEGVYYSRLVVLRGPNGYYIGRLRFDETLMREENGTCESEEYYPTQAAAAQALESGAFTTHIAPELEDLYEAGIIPLPKNICSGCHGSKKVPQMSSMGGGFVPCPLCCQIKKKG
jgi:hypothetical protein